MSYLVPSTVNSLQSTERSESQRRSPHTASIDILDDDSLLHIFHLYRPFLFGEDEEPESRLIGGEKGWGHGHWWFKLSHVCQRWRNLVLASSSYLGLCLVCTNGTPVADMLAHSPPIPLVVDYNEDFDMNTEEEEGLILALKQRDRVRRVRLQKDVEDQPRFIVVLDEEYPILEYLIIITPESSPGVVLPETFQAPHLHHLVLSGFDLSIRSRLLTAAVGLVTLALVINIPPSYFQPNTLLRWISFMPQLETLVVVFHFPVPSNTIERQITHIPTTTLITLPNLRWFWFQGVHAYLEAIVCRMSTPRIEKLQVFFFEELTFSVPHLLQFMNTTENLRFSNASVNFSSDQVDVATYPHDGADLSQSLCIRLLCPRLNSQVSAAAQVIYSLNRIFSAVENLNLGDTVRRRSSEGRNASDRIEWRKILRSFSNVKTLRVKGGLDKKIARCLQLDDGELPLDLLPELHKLTYSRNNDTDNEFASFIHARQNADRPITVVDLWLNLQLSEVVV